MSFKYAYSFLDDTFTFRTETNIYSEIDVTCERKQGSTAAEWVWWDGDEKKTDDTLPDCEETPVCEPFLDAWNAMYVHIEQGGNDYVKIDNRVFINVGDLDEDFLNTTKSVGKKVEATCNFDREC